MTSIICGTQKGFLDAVRTRRLYLPECRRLSRPRDLDGLGRPTMTLYYVRPMSTDTEDLIRTARLLKFTVEDLP